MRYPRAWDWANEVPPRPLAQYAAAPDTIGFYELGFLVGGEFVPQYAGRAMGITLRARLGQHFAHSHNPNVREHRDSLLFRCKTFANEKLTAYVEAVSIAAFEYPWNRRNEWAPHWVLES